MPANETLKEYLVKIGWNVDMKGFKIAGDLTDKLKEKLTSNAGKMGSAFITAASTIVSAIDSINASMMDLIFKTADADLAIEKLARRFYAAEQNVRSYRYALDALGEDEGDLFYMTDEQYNRFIQLNSLGKRLEAPKELDDYLVKVRDLQFEFSKIKMFLDYGRRWIVYWLGRMQGPQFVKLTNFFKRLTTFIEKNLPKITYGIAKFFDIFIRLGTAAFTIARSIFDIFASIDPAILKIGASLLGLFAIIKAGPIGWLIMSILFLLALIDDYLTWKRGGDSLFDWTEFDEKFTELKNNFKTLKKEAATLKKELSDLFAPIKEIFDKLDVKQILLKTIEIIVSAIAESLKIIADALGVINTIIKYNKGEIEANNAPGAVADYLASQRNPEDNKSVSSDLEAFFADQLYSLSEFLDTPAMRWISDFLNTKIGDPIPKFGNYSNSNQTITNNFNIDGARDPQETADAVVDAIGRNRNSWVPVGG